MHTKYYPAKRFKWTTYSLEFIKSMIEGRRNNEKDNIFLITGSRGDGKSTFTGKILFQFNDFDPYEAIVYTKEAFFKQLKKKRNYAWVDEGIVVSAKGNVMSRTNKLLFEAITINRNNFNTIFLLMPSVEDFDTKILQYCSAWIHIEKRGLAVMLLPQNKGLFGKKLWDIDRMKKVYDEFMKEEKKGNAMPYWCFENFVGYIKFGKLTKKQQEIVDEIKELRKNENLDKQSQTEVVVEVKELTNYKKYASIQLAEKVMKGEIRDIEVFKLQCTDLKLDFEETIKKCDSILKRNNVCKTTKGLIKSYEKEDNLIKF